MIWVELAVIAVILYLGTAPLEAWLDVSKRPTEPMEWCHKHGYFRKKHALIFMNTTICPMCYNAAWRHAEGKR